MESIYFWYIMDFYYIISIKVAKTDFSIIALHLRLYMY